FPAARGGARHARPVSRRQRHDDRRRPVAPGHDEGQPAAGGFGATRLHGFVCQSAQSSERARAGEQDYRERSNGSRHHQHDERHGRLSRRARSVSDTRRGGSRGTCIRSVVLRVSGFAVSEPTVATPFDWQAAGRKLGATLDAFHAVIVTGADPSATGYVALGIGEAQATRRRAVVGDLFADSPPIASLVTSEDAHGLVDSFLYGVSLSRISHPVPDAGQLFVMPSGSEPPVFEEMLPNPRWKR